MNSPRDWSEASDSEVINSYSAARSLVKLLEQELETRVLGHPEGLEAKDGAAYRKVVRKSVELDKYAVTSWARENEVEIPLVVDMKEFIKRNSEETIAMLIEAGLTRKRETVYYVAKPSTQRNKPKLLQQASKDE